MRIFDISLTISPQLPVWPGDPAIRLEKAGDIGAGDDANVTRIDMSAHSGTHVDAPHHFLHGSATVDQLPLRTLVGRAFVAHLSDRVMEVDRQVLENAEIPLRTRRLLLRTRNSKFWQDGERDFQKDFTAITADGAEYLVERGIRLVGMDYLSVAPFDAGRPTHEILLQAGVVLLEGVNLSEVEQGHYSLYCLPLKLEGADGAPARAILLRD